jgi:hypothetical protein
MTTKEQIFNSDDLTSKKVDVPEWGCEIILRVMTGADRDKYMRFVSKQDGIPENMMERLIVLTAYNESGEKLFTDSDIPELSKKSSLVITRLFSEATRLNKISNESLDELKND